MRTQFCIYGEPRGKERPKFSTVCGHVTARTPENTVLYENLSLIHISEPTRP